MISWALATEVEVVVCRAMVVSESEVVAAVADHGVMVDKEVPISLTVVVAAAARLVDLQAKATNQTASLAAQVA